MERPLLIATFALLSALSFAQEVIEVEPVGIIPAGEDYAPFPLDSGFVMCSVRESSGMIDFKDADTEKPLSDLYWVPYSEGKAGTPVLFSASLTTPVNEGPFAFTAEGRTICFTRNLSLPKKLSNLRSNSGQLGLFFSDRIGDTWATPAPFQHNSPKYAILHPTFSPKGDTLFFASDMPGGQGGMDLYMSIKSGANWSMPINLGIEVNSSFNEAYPRVQEDGSMHFSSDRPGGPGKLDIYTTALEQGEWLSALALPVPVNSTGNDFGYALMQDGRTALMSSDRDGTDRIYTAKRTVPKFRDCTPQQLNNYCYSLKTRPQAVTNTLPLDHVWDFGDGTRINGDVANHCYRAPGVYTITSLLVDRKSGSVFRTLRSQELVVEDHVQAFIAAQDTVRTGRMVVLDPRLTNVPGMEIAEYHWDLGDGNISSGKKAVHQYKKPGTYELRLDVLSVPDANGSITNRCNTKVITVIDRYREDEDMTIAAVYQDAFGNTHSFEFQELPYDQLSVDNEQLTDAKFAVELFASRERISLDDPRFAQVRKHYRVVEQFDPKRGSYIYSVGETNDMEELYSTFRKVKELDFLDSEVFVLQEEKLLDLSSMDHASLEELNEGKLRLNSILFAYKSATIEPGSDEVLDKVADLLRQHPELELVIEAHTDDIGSRNYNIDLSQQRANSVVEQLVARGIEQERMVSIGLGKNAPVADNRTEAGRSLNRRVEFRMTVDMEDQARQLKR